jgi:hypothetical protein
VIVVEPLIVIAGTGVTITLWLPTGPAPQEFDGVTVKITELLLFAV